MDDLATIAAALGDPLRIRILDLLAAGRRNACCSPANPEAPVALCACDVAKPLGGLAPSKLAYHLGHLRAAGLVHEQRRGKWVYYSINDETLARMCRLILSRWGPDTEAAKRPRGKRPARATCCAPRGAR